MDKMSVRVQGLIRLSHVVIILLIGRHVDNLFGDTRIVRVGFVDHTVRRLDKSVLIDAGIGSQRIDQTDIGSLRSLDRAHTAIVGIVYVSNLESGAVS